MVVRPRTHFKCGLLACVLLVTLALVSLCHPVLGNTLESEDQDLAFLDESDMSLGPLELYDHADRVLEEPVEDLLSEADESDSDSESAFAEEAATAGPSFDLSSFSNSGEALNAYAKFHADALSACSNGNNEVKFLVYSQSFKSLGLGNYLMTIVHLTVAAMTSGRVMLWHLDGNMRFDQLFDKVPFRFNYNEARARCPNAFEATNVKIVSKQDPATGISQFEEVTLKKTDLRKSLKSRVTMIANMYSWMMGVLENRVAGPHFKRVFPNGVARDVARWILRPVKEISDRVEQEKRDWHLGQSSHFTVGVQVRVPTHFDEAGGGDPYHAAVRPPIFATCGKRLVKAIRAHDKSLDSKQVQFFVTASRGEVRDQVSKLLQPAKVYQPQAPPRHTARQDGKQLENTRNALVDIFTLAECDAVIAVENSAFGRISTLLKANGGNVLLFHGTTASECDTVVSPPGTPDPNDKNKDKDKGKDKDGKDKAKDANKDDTKTTAEGKKETSSSSTSSSSSSSSSSSTSSSSPQQQISSAVSSAQQSSTGTSSESVAQLS